MAANINKWSLTAASNDAADPAINWAEGQAPSTVNNSNRAMMQGTAADRDDTRGALSFAGTSTAMTLTTNSVNATQQDGLQVSGRITAANGLNPTLSVDSLAAKNIYMMTAAGFIQLPVNTTVVGQHATFQYNSTLNSAAGGWVMVSPHSGLPVQNDRIINGGMIIDQRNQGASVSCTAGAATFTVDRFFVTPTGAAVTAQQVAGSGQFVNALQLTGATSNTACLLTHIISGDDTKDLVGLNAIVQLRAQVSSNRSVTWNVYYMNAKDNYSGGKTLISTGTLAVTTSLQSFLFTVNNLPSQVVNGIVIELSLGALVAAQTFTTTGWQFDTVAVPFVFKKYNNILIECLRFYWTTGGQTNQNYVFGLVISTTQAQFTVPFPVPMRAAPTFSAVAIGNFTIFDGSTNNGLSALTLASNGTPLATQATIQGTGSGLTLGRCAKLGNGAVTNTFLIFDAEIK